MRISFDKKKRNTTLKERGIDFNDAPELFAGFHFTRIDDREDYGEVRNISLGVLRGQVVVVVWTERNDSRRIISMRKANEYERTTYVRLLG